MILSSTTNSGPVLMVIELCFTALAATVAFGWPRLGNSFFSRIEHLFGRLARRKRWAVITVGVSEVVLRLGLLPLISIPKPFSPDDFSFLLAGDTFALGRLTNPTPAMWVHFESIHITMNPTYMSMYFPGQGLLLAAGKVLLGHPWYGILCMSALMCAGICWMLQAWLPPTWALLGGILAVLHLGLFSYWVNTYTGAGTISALGGALVLGALPRFLKGARLRHGLLLAIGAVLLALTRPYEGLLLCVPVVVVLARWLLYGKNRPAINAVIVRNVLPLLLLVAAGVWMGYYDYRAFGNPTTLPYTVDRATYAIAPYYIWQSTRPTPVYRHEALRKFYCDFEPDDVGKVRSLSGFAKESLSKIKCGLLFFAGTALLIPLIMLRRVLLDRRVRFLVVCGLLMVVGMSIEIYLIPHYLAPFTVVFYAIGLQCMRHLRFWRPEGRMVGLATIRLTVALCFALGTVRLFATPLHFTSPMWPAGAWLWSWYGPGNFGANRADLQASLEQLAGKQLVIVRYSPQHYPQDEWVYNSAEIDDSKVIWARDMDASKNLELLHYYKNRKVWMVEPDSQPAKVYPYPGPQ